MNIFLLILSILPVFLVGLFVYYRDYEKEDVNFLLKLLFGGFLSCILVLILTYILRLVFPFFSSNYLEYNIYQMIIYVFIGIGLIEEVSKWIFLYLFTYNNKNFDEVYDVIVYAVFISLGFALLENMLYVLNNDFKIGLLRAITAVPTQACYGVIMGYFMGNSKYNNRNSFKQNIYLILSVVVSVFIHGLYDFLILYDNGDKILLVLILLPCLYYTCIKIIIDVSASRKKILYDEELSR